MKSRTRALTALATIAILLSAGRDASAQRLTGITYTPNRIIVGYAVQYKCTDDGSWPIQLYTWSYKCGGCTLASTGTGNPVSYYESRVGPQVVVCTAKFMATSGGSPGEASVSTTVDVLPPDRDEVKGLGVDTEAFTAAPMIVRFEVRNQDKLIGPYVDGFPQERIRRPQFQQDTGWLDGAPGKYYLQNGVVAVHGFGRS